MTGDRGPTATARRTAPPSTNPSSGGASRERVYAAVVAHHSRHGYAPTVREVAAATGLAVSTAAYHLDQLRAAGRINHRTGRARTAVPAAG